jgi:hypothetical protein
MGSHPQILWPSARLAIRGCSRLVGVPIRLRGLCTKENQRDPADHRKEVQELPPPASVDVVQATRCNRNAGQEGCKRKHCSQVMTENSKRYGHDQREHKPPPKLRTGRAAVEIRIFHETGFNGVNKVHETRWSGSFEDRSSMAIDRKVSIKLPSPRHPSPI